MSSTITFTIQTEEELSPPSFIPDAQLAVRANGRVHRAGQKVVVLTNPPAVCVEVWCFVDGPPPKTYDLGWYVPGAFVLYAE